MSHGSDRSPLWPGVPLALGSAALFGAAPLLSKLLLETVNPLMLARLLYLGAGVGWTFSAFVESILGFTRPAFRTGLG